MKDRRLYAVSAALLSAVVVAGLGVWSPAYGQTAATPPTFSEFLQQFVGQELLVVDRSVDMGQTEAPDSLDRYLALLESVNERGIVIRRNLQDDKRTLMYTFADIRRVTYLFAGKRYPRIVIETQ